MYPHAKTGIHGRLLRLKISKTYNNVGIWYTYTIEIVIFVNNIL